MSFHVIVIVFVYSCIVFVDILSLLTMLMLDILILLFVDATGWLNVVTFSDAQFQASSPKSWQGQIS